MINTGPTELLDDEVSQIEGSFTTVEGVEGGGYIYIYIYIYTVYIAILLDS